MRAFEFATATRILFGRGTLAEVGRSAGAFGRRAFLLCGSDPGRAARLVDFLHDEGIEVLTRSVHGEPSFDSVRRELQAARGFATELVIGFGGGSVIDSAKAIAALLANPGDPLEYAEVIGAGRPLSIPALPFIAIPTTAGTGSEVTRNAVLASETQGVKVSLRSATMLARLAVVDPELCRGLPPAITASTGMDALTQLIEPFVSNRANPLTDALCREGIAGIASALPRAFLSGEDLEAREQLSLAALFGGMALANARLGLVHGFAAPIGGRFHAPHGAICAALLPAVVSVNLRALRLRDSANPVLGRYAEVAGLLRPGSASVPTGAGEPEEAAAALGALTKVLRIGGLASLGVGTGDFPELIERAKTASSTQGNPITLTDAELLEILERSL